MTLQIDPKLDLVLDRTIQVPRSFVWKGWTDPELLMKWFCPLPWKTTECQIDLRPGGIFRTVMKGPDGNGMTNVGCFLEVIPNEKLVWTAALQPGYRPQSAPGMLFSAAILLEQQGKETRYRAVAIHKNEADRDQHDKMGFHEGWGKALDQLVALYKP